MPTVAVISVAVDALTVIDAVVFVPVMAVGIPPVIASGLGASCAVIWVETYAVVATLVELSFTLCVGAVGVPVNAGDAKGANDVATNAVVANCVVFVPGEAVGAAGVPVNVGDAIGAYDDSAGVAIDMLPTPSLYTIWIPVDSVADVDPLAAENVTVYDPIVHRLFTIHRPPVLAGICRFTLAVNVPVSVHDRGI